jgi:cytochrome oxidase assembly protein ShyY1
MVLIGVMSVLGWWQLSVFDERQRAAGQARLDEPPVPLDDLMGPDDPIPSGGVGRPVLVEGRYAAANQLYVEGLPGHQASYAVVTPLLTGSGSAILVVRGSSDTTSAPPPEGAVTVKGVLEAQTAEGSEPRDDGVTDGVRVAALAQDIDVDLYSAYIVLTSSTPPDPLPPVEPPTPDASLWDGARNLAYALQWWVFAAFVAFMWWKIAGDSEDGHEESVR